MASLIPFEIESFVKGYHAYQYEWSPIVDEVLKAKIKPTNIVDKYAVCVLHHDRVVGHLKRGKSGRFTKTIFYFLRADTYSSCTVIIKGKDQNVRMTKIFASYLITRKYNTRRNPRLLTKPLCFPNMKCLK
jgi:hypothetical protein